MDADGVGHFAVLRRQYIHLDVISKESEAFKLLYSELEAVNPRDINGQLYARNMISKADRDEISNDKASLNDRVGALLRAVERAIQIDKENFYTFVEILKPQYKVLAARLKLAVDPPSSQQKPHPINPLLMTPPHLPSQGSYMYCWRRCFIAIILVAAIAYYIVYMYLPTDIPQSVAFDKNWRQQLNEWIQQRHAEKAFHENCMEQGGQHHCTIVLYCKTFQSKAYNNKNDAKEEVAKEALTWVEKTSFKTRLNDYCQQHREKCFEPSNMYVTDEVHVPDHGFKSQVKFREPKMDPVVGDVKPKKVDAENSAAEKALAAICGS